MKQIITELQDLRYLEWSKTKHSSGTGGSFLKSYENYRGKKIYYKLSDYNSVEGIVGHECVNEIIADRLLEMLGIEHLSYRLIHAQITINGKDYITYLCASENFLKPGESKIALDTYYEMEAEPGESPLDFCIRRGWEDYVWDMLLIDYLITNRDRHGANIEVLRNRKEQSLRLAPLYDHGLSLAFSCHDDKALAEYDIYGEKKVQCFLGTHSVLKNVGFIPRSKRRSLPVFDERFRQKLFEGLEGIVTSVWMDTIWNMLTMRAKEYEDLCNNRQL